MKKELAKVVDAKIIVERGAFLTFRIKLDYEGPGVQSFGGYALDTYDEEKERRVGTAGGCDVIKQLLSLFEVNTFDKMIGRVVYVLKEDDKSIIEGLEIPGFDGGGKFLVSEWREEWFEKDKVSIYKE